MTSRKAYRKTTFNIPSNRSLWQSLGQFDSLVEYMETAGRTYLGMFDGSNESFRDFISRTSKSVGINLNDISLANYIQTQHQSYLILPNASFDDFLSDYVEDVRYLFDSSFELSKVNGCKFDKLIDALNDVGINPAIEQHKLDLYNYYRLLRNDFAHHLEQDYYSEYQTLDIKAIHKTYPMLGNPQIKSNLSFDDFILCTANIKNIADILTLSLLPHINWVDVFNMHKNELAPRCEQFAREKRPKRLRTYISNCFFNKFAIKPSDTVIETIAGSLE